MPAIAGVLPNAAIPFQINTRVHVHHNAVYNNASLGDALFSGTPSGAGGVTISAGADNYRLDHNWVAGNLKHWRRRRVAHSGLSFNGTIDHNYILSTKARRDAADQRWRLGHHRLPTARACSEWRRVQYRRSCRLPARAR